MKAKTFLTSLILMAILAASTSYASVTPQQAASDQRIGPFVEFTKQNGAKFIPGRYAHTNQLPSRTGGDKILAPTKIILELMPFSSESNAYPLNFDVYGEDLERCYMTFDTTGEVPIQRIYMYDEDEDDYELFTEDYAVVIQEGNKYAWCLASVETGELRYLFPLTPDWFPENWYLGDWECSDGSRIEFADGKVLAQGQEFGTYIVSDNRIAIKTPSGERDVICAMYNADNDTLVMTFTSGPNGMDENAGVFTRKSGKPTPSTTPKSPAPEKKPAPKFQAPKDPQAPKFTPKKTTPEQTPETEAEMPTGFPKMPKVDFPEPTISLEGVWGAIVNGQQWVTQYQGNQYYGWINGVPSEMGIFQINGNVISGRTTNGVTFQAEINFDQSGKFMTLTFPNGNSINYQRMQ